MQFAGAGGLQPLQSKRGGRRRRWQRRSGEGGGGGGERAERESGCMPRSEPRRPSSSKQCIAQHACYQVFMFGHVTMFAELYGKKAAALYTQAQDYQKTARFYYGKV